MARPRSPARLQVAAGLLALGSLLGSLLPAPATALVAGARDPSFGDDGVALVRRLGGQLFPSVAIDGLGRILVGGSEGGGGIVTRLLPDGSLDREFGSYGFALVPDPVHRLLLLSDGGAATIGKRAGPLPRGPRVTRLTPSGAIDKSYGEHGSAQLFGDVAGVAALDSGRVAASVPGARGLGRIWVFDRSGQPDATFAARGGTEGSRGYPFPLGAIDADNLGRIYIVSDSGSGSRMGAWADASLRRLTPTGDVDSTFGQNGVATLPSAGDLVPRLGTIDVTAAGIAVAGDVVTRSGDPTLFVAAGRFDFSGRPVASFGTAGFAFEQADLGTTRPQGAAHLFVDSSDRLVISETYGSIMRLTKAGVPDPTFDFEGRRPSFHYGYGLVEAAGGILLPTSASEAAGTPEDLGLLRLLGEPAGPTSRIAGIDPVGSLDGAGGGGSSILLRGWAIDPDTARDLRVVPYVDGSPAALQAPAVDSRPDLAAAFPAYGARHGYQESIPASLGPHEVCLHALNVELGSQGPQAWNLPPVSTNLGCKTVIVGNGHPFGAFDEATRSGDELTVRGWVIDPDTTASIDVHLYLDGRLLATRWATGDRPDVDAAHPAYGPNHGWRHTATVSSGSHTICAYGINVDTGAINTPIGCKLI